jgi:hypothetical protein
MMEVITAKIEVRDVMIEVADAIPSDIRHDGLTDAITELRNARSHKGGKEAMMKVTDARKK